MPASDMTFQDFSQDSYTTSVEQDPNPATSLGDEGQMIVAQRRGPQRARFWLAGV